MKPEDRSRTLLAITRSKAKMYEYGLPETDHIRILRDPAMLLRLTVGTLGDVAASVSRQTEIDLPRLTEMSRDLRFAARYFDAYLASRLSGSYDSHLLLLSSAAYYLCDLPGSSGVLASHVQPSQLHLDAGGLEHLLYWLLRGDFKTTLKPAREFKYRIHIGRIAHSLHLYYALYGPGDNVLNLTARLRQMAYAEGTPREVLFADVCCAIVKRRIENSARHLLPTYSSLPLAIWAPTLRKTSFMQELWPAQRLLGQRSVFMGASAVIQMPTSAGKSRSTELIIRSAFLTRRASLAVIVAPFRALCHEIRESLAHSFLGEGIGVNEISDVMQKDFNLDDLITGPAILVMTPEKLVYVLRHAPELADSIGLLVLDEGHQFDSGARGVTYELLVTSLKALIPEETQKVLISAVISNAAQIATWFDDTAEVIVGSHLIPTERTVAFASWKTRVGQLHFVEPDNPEREEFFVPRVIKSATLRLRPRERKPQHFPAKDDSRSVALYLGLTLVGNGAVAIFCGRKDTASGLCETLTDVFDRGLELPSPVTVSDDDETARLTYMYERNLGSNSTASRAAKIGVFTHHGNTPQGVRLAVEHAIKEGLARFVICTSTLAQGVNLPIRYLIVTSDRQGGEPIKVRDFQNLMGRAGRSGMHTEGSILFANPEVYDTRFSSESRWPDYKALLRVEDSEPCASTLLSVLGPLRSDGGRGSLAIDPLVLAQAYIADQSGRGAWVDEVAAMLGRRWFSPGTLRRQLGERRKVFATIESFLLAHWQESNDEQALNPTPSGELAKRTLAYHLGSPIQKSTLIRLFELLSENVAVRVTIREKRRVYGRTLLGVGDTIALEHWVSGNKERIIACDNDDELFEVVWPCIVARIENNTFKKCYPPETTEDFAKGWIAGDSFGELHDHMLENEVRIGSGARPRKPTVENIVEMGEKALAFDGAHVLGAITELFELQSQGEEKATVLMLHALQKRIKYGLPSKLSIFLYEAGFSDRPLSIDLAEIISKISPRMGKKGTLRAARRPIEKVLAKYPNYFQDVFKQIAGV